MRALIQKLQLGVAVLPLALGISGLLTGVASASPLSVNASCVSGGTMYSESSTACRAGSSVTYMADVNNCSEISKCDLMTKYVYPFINFLSALVGLVVVISIVIGGIQYGSSAGDPQKVTAAKNRIRNALIALVTFIFLYSLLNFLVPGGLFQ
jgi:hypothetical protein